MSNSEENPNKTSTGLKNCLSWIILFAIVGWVAEKCDKCGFLPGSLSINCDVCGSYSYEDFAENAFSDSDVADMVGANRVDEYKQRLKSEPAAIHVLDFTDPKTLDDGTIRGTAMIGIQSKLVNGITTYKGTFIKTKDEEDYDGIIRIEYKRNDVTNEWEQITFNNYQNAIFYTIKDKNLLLKSATNNDTYGICCYKDAVFKKD